MAQTLKVLLWKIYILRKRRWIITLLEIVIPILMFWLLTRSRYLFPVSSSKISHDAQPEQYSSMVGFELDSFKIAYAPSNTFTDTIMNEVNTQLKAAANTVTMVSQTNEDTLVEWLREQYLDEVGNSTDVFAGSTVSNGVGVVFINPGDTTSLQYTLRTTKGSLSTSDDTLHGEQNSNSFYAYENSGFVTVQAAVDQAYLTKYKNIQASAFKNVYLEYLPIIQNGALQLLSTLLPYVIALGFNFCMSSLIRGIVDEKSSGIKEMMKIMGLKPWVNWVNWLAFSMLVYVPVTLIISLILTIDSGLGPAIDINVFVLWVLFLLFTFAFVALIFVMTTFFTNGTVALVTGLIIWYVVSIVLNTTFVSNPDSFGLWLHLLTCLWPTVAIQWSINTVNIFQINGHPWTLSNLFDDGVGGGRVSVGLAAIMLIVDFFLYSFLTWYIDNVNPGPYGRAKPLSFIFQCFCFKNKEYDSRSSIKTKHHHNFEAPPQGARVGIKIENLRKTFNGGKVVAVENVDLDIYEGNITALLGHNGAGKTTTMSILSGFVSPTSGKVLVKGKNVFDNIEEFRSNLGLCPQHNLLFTYFTVIEHLIFFGMLKGFSKQQSEVEGMSLLRTFKIDEKKNELVSKLSGGMKRRLCLCISLMGNPQVLMLDEPTSGLDPETRRQVWDVLLNYRGHRTILITTHFMEEADILGDRIAIMDHGQVSCYGTSMFLKKLYGTGYHLDISKVEQAPVAPITRVVEQHVESATIKISSPTQLMYNIKSEESSKFPALFAALDGWKKDLGLTGMGITCTTMEDVFLKVAEKPESYTDTNGNVSNEAYFSKHTKVTGFSLMFLQVKALAFKRSLTWLKTWKSTLYMLLLTVLLAGYTVYRMMSYDFSPNQPILLLSLASFTNVRVAVSSTSSSITTMIQNMVTTGKATYNEIPTGTDFEDYFDQQIYNNLIQYERQIIAGFKYNSTSFVGGYSRYFTHALPMVQNMLANSLIQINNPSGSSSSSITVYNHPIAIKNAQSVCDLVTLAPSHLFLFPMIMTFFSFGLMVLMKSFIAFPVKERVTSAKQLQLMTGLSPILYWTVTFLCDFVLYTLTAVLIIACVIIFQQNKVFTASGYMGTLILVFFLFGCSGLAFAYFISFLVSSSVKGAVVFMLANLITGTVPSVFLAVLGRFDPGYGYIRFILSFNPIYSATTALTYLFSAMYINGLCLQCGNGCETEDPLQFLQTGIDSKAPYGINNSLIFLAVDTVIYFGLVMLIEYGVVKKLWFLMSKMWIKLDYEKMDEDSDVWAEKERVKTSHSVRVTGQGGNSAALRVKDLGKKYNRKMTAVYGVTFQVNQGECFGLLGVNGAGKSTTFKMLTGEEVPNKGDASIQQISLLKQKSRFLAKIGYCPQFDALNKLLTGKQMLRIYAQLRGIPSANCESEVSRWIEIMGLAEFGDRPCGTYSGGNKRKLSTAIAFIGEPPVVFLDEPTSGVDPVSRRKLWDVVAKCQQAGQAIVLTSHSMEECEALCSRLTIMVAGQMKCIGTTQHLKHKFGQGYLIKIKLLSSQDPDRLKSDMASYFRGCSVKDEHLGLLDYHIPDSNTKLAELFSKMEHLKNRHEIIEDYVVSDTTLEQVFMSFARQPLPPKTTQV